jgi:MurNAc alpha-1-phosphate uridylyltransferase
MSETQGLPKVSRHHPGSMPARAMLLAAGLGLRMRPITDTLPKPLIAVGGRTLLDRILDQLAAAGVVDVIVNVHHLAERIERHLALRAEPRVLVSHEPERLETGGGIKRVLHRFAGEAFFVVNGDILWRDAQPTALETLASRWDAATMDALLLLQPTATARGYAGAGDFSADGDGRLIRRGDRPTSPYFFAGIQILHPRLFAAAPDGAFSLNLLYDAAGRRGRLFGAVHRGGWCHVGTPQDIPIAEDFLAGRAPESS